MKKFENFIVNNSINLNLIEILIKAKFEIFRKFVLGLFISYNIILDLLSVINILLLGLNSI